MRSGLTTNKQTSSSLILLRNPDFSRKFLIKFNVFVMLSVIETSRFFALLRMTLSTFLGGKNEENFGLFCNFRSLGFCRWTGSTITNTKIEKDVDNNVFRMYFSVDGQYSWVVELSNAKRCMDECYGIEGCEVSINPSADISNVCVVEEP